MYSLNLLVRILGLCLKCVSSVPSEECQAILISPCAFYNFPSLWTGKCLQMSWCTWGSSPHQSPWGCFSATSVSPHPKQGMCWWTVILCRLWSFWLYAVLCHRPSSEAGGGVEFGSHHHCGHVRHPHFTLAVHRAGNVADHPSQLEVCVQIFTLALAPPTLKERKCVKVNYLQETFLVFFFFLVFSSLCGKCSLIASLDL